MKNKIKIKLHTFFKKGFRSKRGNFGVYCYDGKQGCFKTYSVVEFLLQNKDKKIYSNIHTLKGVEYTQVRLQRQINDTVTRGVDALQHLGDLAVTLACGEDDLFLIACILDVHILKGGKGSIHTLVD